VAGGAIAWVVRHPALLVGGLVVGVGALVGASVVTFAAGGWVPLVTPAIALVLSMGGVAIYRAYHESKNHKDLATMWLERAAVPMPRSRPR
jgi:CHASE2 domain-containing sensor protein